MTPTAEAPALHRRTSDPSPQIELREFEIPVPPGSKSVAYADTQHEHAVDPVRASVTCETCWTAIHRARGADMLHFTAEIDPDDWVTLVKVAREAAVTPEQWVTDLVMQNLRAAAQLAKRASAPSR